MQNLFSKLIVQIPIEPPAAMLSTPTGSGQNAQPPSAQQLVQATLASLATAATSSSAAAVSTQQILANNLAISSSAINKSEDIEQFYAVITKTIIDNMNSTATSIGNTTDRYVGIFILYQIKARKETKGTKAKNGSRTDESESMKFERIDACLIAEAWCLRRAWR